VRHPDLERWVAKHREARHADEVVDGQIEYAPHVGLGEHGGTALRRDEIEHADLVARPEGTAARPARDGVARRDQRVVVLRGHSGDPPGCWVGGAVGGAVAGPAKSYNI
jgi:hypothetical protein